MKKSLFLLAAFVLLKIFSLSAQEISGVVFDSKTGSAVPFATVQYAPHQGAITNDEGRFSIISAETDSISISCLGYDAITRKVNKFSDDTIFLKPSSIQLDDVFLSNKNLTGEEIMERVIARVDSNYDAGLTRKKFFLRNSFFDHINNFDLKVEESSMPELDQDFMDEVEAKIPQHVDSYNEYLGELYGNYDSQKVQLLKADKLDNPVNTESFEELNQRIEKILQKKVGAGTYLKVKSGIIGVKMDSEELNKEIEEGKEAEKPKEKTAEEKAKEELEKRKNIKNQAQNLVAGKISKMFWKEDLDLDVFEKTRKYDFKVEGFAQLDNSLVYIISFKPKRKADYKGKIYVNTQDFGVHRMDFTNLRPLKKFRLLGISSIDDVHRGKVIFNRDEEGKYNLKYLEEERGTTVGIERPLTFLVKKGKFLWKKKLDELDLEMDINVSNVNKTQLLIYESGPLQKPEFENLETSAAFEYEVFKKYNPEFWSGNNIIEPNAAIKSFTSLEEE
ncbi:MAG: carboxypeptidase-like regulatory domain-containing protein [Salegentibacter sp.]